MIEIREQTNEVLATIMREQALVATIYTRIVIIRLSQIDEKSRDDLYGLIRPLIKECFKDLEGRLLHFADHDMVIISRLTTRKSYEIFCDSLAGLSLVECLADKLCAIYELPADAPAIKNFMIEKATKKDVVNVASVMKVNPRAEFVELPIAPNLIASLKSRRQNRAEIIIQIIEDDMFSQRIAYNILRDKATVLASYTGQQALSSYVTQAPDLVFLDIGLPDIDGQRILERLLQYDPMAHIVMLSGNGSKENILKAVNTGAKGFIGKPFSHQKIMQSIAASPFIQAKQKKQGEPYAGF